MNPPSPQIIKTWISSIKCGEVTQLLSDESAVQELHLGCDGIIAQKALSLLASKIFELKTKSLDAVFPGATPLHLYNLSDIFSSLYVKNKTSDSKDESYITSLYHVIAYLLKEGFYESALNLKSYIEEVGYGYSSLKDKQRTMLFHNFYLMFWNGSVDLEKKSGDLESVLHLRLTAIDLLAHAHPSKLPTVSERIIVTSRMYVINSKNSVLSEAASKMCNALLEIATTMVNTCLKSNHESESQVNSVEMTDSLFIFVKSYSEVLVEVMRVHNLYSKGREGLELCIKYCKMFCGGEHLQKSFYGFLDVLCDIFSQVAAITAGDEILRKDFRSIHLKLCELQNLSDSDTKITPEHVYCGIKFKSLSFLKASEYICRAIVDLWASQNIDDSLGICAKDESSLLLLLELGGKLNMSSDLSYSLKFMAFSLKIIIHMISVDSEDAGFGEYNHKVVKAKEILIFCMNIEEKIDVSQPNSMKSAVNVLFHVLHVAIPLFIRKKLLVTCEEFLMKYHKLLSKWLECHEFSVLKDRQWWCIKSLCTCRRDQKKFRAALAALALAVENRVTEKYSSVFNEWAKVKISAQLSDEAGEMQMSTIHHILKENIKDKNWHFTNEDINRLLKLEMYVYMSKEVCMNNEIQDVCRTILEVSSDVTLKAEAQLCLIELSCTPGSSDLIFGAMATESGDGMMKSDVGLNPLKIAVKSCQKLAADFQKEIRNASVPENVPAMLCVLGHIYYFFFLCKYSFNQEKAKNELSGNGSIPLRVPKKVDVNGQEEDEASSCDIVPPQLCLKSSKQKQLLSATLNVAVALWEHADEKSLKISDQEKFNVTVILKCIETSAYIYELYDDLWHSTKAWCLLCKYADIFMKDEAYSLGISNLMRKGAVSLKAACLLRVDNITTKLNKESPLLLTYLLGKCWQYLYACEYSAGIPILGKVLKDCSPGMSEWHSILYAQAKFLLALYYMQSPMDLTGSEHCKDQVFLGCTRYDSAISALGTLIRLFGSWENSGSMPLYIFAQALLLDVSLWIGELFLDLNIPREAYGYLKQQFLLAQKFLLPNRTVQFLVTLAFVDLISCNKNDCEVKLLGMESIIDLDHEKDKDQQIGDIQNLIQWLVKGKNAAKKSDLIFESALFTEDSDEMGLAVKAKKFMGRYSPQRPGSNYKFMQMKRCADNCFCEWCMNSGFQKAFSGLRVVQVCLANKSQGEYLLPPNDIFENSNRILRSISNRFKVLILKMSRMYLSILPSEVGQTIDPYLDHSDFFGVEMGRLHAYYVRFMFNMVDFYLMEWENSDASQKDFISKSETLITVVEEETKDMKYLYGFPFLEYHMNKLKLIVGKARMMSPVNQVISSDKYDEEYRQWSKKGQAQPEVCKTPSKEMDNASRSRKLENVDLNGGDEIYDPIPSVPKRNLPRQNLNLNFKEEEELSQRGRTKKVTVAGIKIKKVTNSDSGASKLKKEIGAGTKGREVFSVKSDTSKVKKDVATGVSNSVAKNDADDKLTCDTRTRRKPNKK